jgi:uncharacterized NAD(P)/FAD-binding protein YdhS
MVRTPAALSVSDTVAQTAFPPGGNDSQPSEAVADIVARLRKFEGQLSAERIVEVLSRSSVTVDDVAPFVAPTRNGYGRRCIVRTEKFEVLVMTWLPGQRTGPHDHAGAISVFKILAGQAHETRFVQRVDSLVEPLVEQDLRTGEVGSDAGELIHDVRNDAKNDDLLVSLHIYSPPLPELRRFSSVRASGVVPRPFGAAPAPTARTVAIVGGGYSGAMVVAQLARRRAADGQPLHILWFDRQTSIAEGAAYRTPDASHLLNVPASNMSAWPDRPDSLIDWCLRRGATTNPYSFLDRRTYGEYLRETLFDALADSAAGLSVEFHRGEIDSIERRTEAGWRLRRSDGALFEAELVVLATGHRPPDDPLADDWSGASARYVRDPWAALALASIAPEESVCLLGTGLTAIDVLQSLSRTARIGPILALSRRGLLPATHAPVPMDPIDPQSWLEPLLARGNVRLRALTGAIREQVRHAVAQGLDWRQVVDGLRPHTARIWRALSAVERRRFLHHLRAFWEVARHRMAPAAANNVGSLAQSGRLRKISARALSGRGDEDGVTLSVCRRGAAASEELRFDWVINCTGPGAGSRLGLPSVITRLIEAHHLEADPLHLGVRTTGDGVPLVKGEPIRDLIIVGTLRKPDLWESTAVPELREQAQAAAQRILLRD